MWEQFTISVNDQAHTVAMAVLDTLLGTKVIVGYTAVHTIVARVTDTLPSPSGQVVTGAVTTTRITVTGSCGHG